MKRHAALLKHPLCDAGTRGVRGGREQHACLLEKFGPPGLSEQLDPHPERPHGPARVDLIRAIVHANDARLSAGTGSTIAWAKHIDEQDTPARSAQMQRRPGAENTRANYDRVETHQVAARRPSNTDLGMFRFP